MPRFIAESTTRRNRKAGPFGPALKVITDLVQLLIIIVVVIIVKTIDISVNRRDNRAELYGAGICLWHTDALIENNIIKENEAGDDGGGGIYCYESTSEIINNVILNNLTNYKGGGICCKKCSDIKIINNIIKINKYGGLLCEECSSSLILNTIYLFSVFAKKITDFVMKNCARKDGPQ